MQNPKLIEFAVIATDPAAEWRSVQLFVRALSRHHARDVARDALIGQKRSHFTIELVVEA